MAEKKFKSIVWQGSDYDDMLMMMMMRIEDDDKDCWLSFSKIFCCRVVGGKNNSILTALQLEAFERARK